MRIAVFILCLIAGAAIAQDLPIDACVADLKNSIALFEKIAADIQSKNVLAIIQDISLGSVQIEVIKADCKQVTKDQVVAWAYKNLLTDKQRECISIVLGAAFTAYNVKLDLDNKNWSAFFQDLNSLTVDVENVKATCNGAF